MSGFSRLVRLTLNMNSVGLKMLESDQTERVMEAEANRFAMELLMPVAWIKKDLEGIEFDLGGGNQLHDLAKRYGVSEMAMIIRLSGLGLKLS